MQVDTLIVFCALVLSAALLSSIAKLIAYGIRQIFLWMNRKERMLEEQLYEDRFAKLAAEAAQGPILLTDMRAA